MPMKWMTVKELIGKLAKMKNMNSCVALCELDREYEPISDVYDETVYPPDGDGNIGVVGLTLSRDDRRRKVYDRSLNRKRRPACPPKRKK